MSERMMKPSSEALFSLFLVICGVSCCCCCMLELLDGRDAKSLAATDGVCEDADRGDSCIADAYTGECAADFGCTGE